MTIILLTVLITTLLSLPFYRIIHRYRYFLYVFFAVIAFALGGEEATIVSLGYVGLGVFLVVMFTGVLNRGQVKKRLTLVRAELSVIATLFILPHALAFSEYLLEDVGVLNGTLSYYVGILAFLVMVPLSLTSFIFIRKWLGGKRWKSLHRFAYLFYALIALHLILIQNDRMVPYIVLFSVYFLLKAYMVITKHRRKAQALKTAKKKG